MLKNTIALFLLCLLLTNFQTQAQEDEVGAWYIVASNSKLSEKFSFQLQTQFRFYELASEIEQFKIRTSGTYKFNEKVSASLGYAYFRNDPSYLMETPEEFDEHRLVEDAHLSSSWGKLGIKHRYRMEHRFFPTRDPLHWARYMLKLTYPLGGSFSADVYDEVFINLQKPLFGQNWFGGGISYKASDLLKVRVGYQNITFENAALDRLLVGITFTPDFTDNDS
ncbi:DUF2490 domain-containing protein [Luteirhabdus pelagi]|uniref:DUF2490 domain-containing protein n=1 Tax=Luteirhabdus pelagi TaxID=2792783 RepID=UPI00193954B8|nr:DUF2490 domain-containing protein [Luteirhabdus pelagi]